MPLESLEARLEKAEASLRECEGRFSRLFRSFPMAIGIYRLSDGRFIEVNELFLHIYGYSREEVIGQTSEELGIWADPEQRTVIVESLARHEKIQEIEFRCRRKSGETGWLLASMELIDLHGDPCVLGAFFDITRRKEIEESFREDERLYRALVEDQTEVICRCRADDTILFVNDVHCRVFGKKREELLGKKWHPLAHPDDLPGISERLRMLSFGNPVVLIENRVFDGSGGLRWMQFVNRGLFDEDGNLQEIQSVGRDITERKMAEEALFAKEQEYRTLVENIPDLIVRYDTELRRIYVNPAWENATGISAAEVIDVHVEDTPRAPRPAVDEYLDRLRNVLQTGTPREIELAWVNPHGVRIYLDFKMAPEYDRNGNVCSVLAVGHDITDRKRAEEALRDNEGFKNAILDAVASLIAVIDKDGFILSVNEPWVRFSIENSGEAGFPAKKSGPGVNYLEVCAESKGESSEGAAAAREGITAVLNGTIPSFSLEYPCHTPEFCRWFMMTVTPLGIGMSGAVISHTDITERVQAEEALKSSESRYRMLFENSMDAIFLTNPDGVVRSANRAACEMFGMTGEELIETGRDGIVDASDPRLAQALAERARTGRYFGELTYIRKDGSRFPAETSSVIMDNGASAFVMLRDISERKKAEEKLLERQKVINSMAMELSLAEERERQQIAEQLHDQIAPKLFLAKMKIHNLFERFPAEESGPAREAIDSLIDLGVQDIRSLTFQLRPPLLADMGLVPALRWLCEEFRESFGLLIGFEDDGEAKPLKYEMSLAIFQVVRELLLNITKHARTRNGSVSLGRDDGAVVVRVEDNGIGFNTEESSLANPRMGGFGSYNARMKIEYLGGEFKIDSTLGEGTKVTIRAPVDTAGRERKGSYGNQDHGR